MGWTPAPGIPAWTRSNAPSVTNLPSQQNSMERMLPLQNEPNGKCSAEDVCYVCRVGLSLTCPATLFRNDRAFYCEINREGAIKMELCKLQSSGESLLLPLTTNSPVLKLAFLPLS